MVFSTPETGAIAPLVVRAGDWIASGQGRLSTIEYRETKAKAKSHDHDFYEVSHDGRHCQVETIECMFKDTGGTISCC